jgi:hypothetical protein
MEGRALFRQLGTTRRSSLHPKEIVGQAFLPAGRQAGALALHTCSGGRDRRQFLRPIGLGDHRRPLQKIPPAATTT